MITRHIGKLLDFPLLLLIMFLANMGAFLAPIWLIEPIVFLEAFAWVFLSLVLFGVLYKQGLVHEYYKDHKGMLALIMFAVFSGISIIWSVNKDVSLARWFVLLGTLIYGWYWGAKYNFYQILRQLSIFGAVLLAGSGLIIILIPDIGVMNYYSIQGAWRGVYWHKNHLGLVSSFLNLIYLIELIRSIQKREKNKLLWGLLFGVSLLFIVMSDSAAALMTSLLLYGILVVLMIWLKWRDRLLRIHYWIFGFVVVAGMIGVYGNLDGILGMFNRNTTLTGRIPMWTYLFSEYFDRRPYLGYGFNAFWYIGEHQKAIQAVAGYPGPIIIADNGFIDILVNTGYVGFSLFLMYYFSAWAQAVKSTFQARDVVGLLPIMSMVFIFLANISWSLMFENESFFMLIMILLHMSSRNIKNHPQS